jgi:hypothetical protein
MSSANSLTCGAFMRALMSPGAPMADKAIRFDSPKFIGAPP